MNKLTYAILLALGSANVNASTIAGTVTDQSGKPITDGFVSVDGSSIKAPISDDGTFLLSGLKLGEVTLHVASPNHIHEHSEFQLTANGIQDATIVVRDASIEVLDVSSVGLHVSTFEGILPATVLAGDKLNRRQEATLGDTLDDEVGVHSSAHGGVVSTPIIRGLSGPRVFIAQNGLDVSDVSRVGPDHMVVTETTNAQQIEVIRGPATLFYGSGAIGGVVNIVNQNIPTFAQNTGEVTLSRNSNNSEEAVNANVIADAGNFVLSASGFYREADEYKVPGMPELVDFDDDHGHDEHDDDDHGEENSEEGGNRVENSDYRVSGFSVGGSYLFDNGFIGGSVEKQDAFYGIPGHGHGGDEEHGHDEHDEEHGEEHDEEHSEEEEVVNLDMEMTRYQFMGRFNPQSDFISEFNFSGAFTDYEHVEFENDERGTEFANQTTEFRFNAMHSAWNDWNGGVSFHFRRSDIEALGEEAFTPPTETSMFGLALFEEKAFGDVQVQLGARIESVELDVPMLFENDVELIEEDHDDDHNDEHGEDDHDEGDHDDMLGSINESFTAMSISAGAVWNFAEGYNASLALSRSERVPSAAELFSLGPHLGSGFFEIGALYNINDENEVVIGAVDFDEEISNNFDFSFRKFSGDLGVVFNLFYNDVENYYFDSNTGLFSEFAHEHGEEHDDEHDHEEEHDDEHDHDDESGHGEEGELLPVLLFTSTDAKVYGAELQVNYQATDNIMLRTQADIVRNRIDTPNGTTEAPRTSPMRWTVAAEFANDNWYADIKVKHVFEQDKIAQFEDPTESYTLVDVNLSYYMTIEDTDIELFLKGRNITDSEARVHTSFLRNDAPIPGRSVQLGVRASF